MVVFVAVGCASFAPVDLRLDEPAALGDTLALGTSESRYQVVGFDPVFYEADTIINCDNTHDEIRARCEEGGICYAIKKVSGSASVEPICMNDEYVAATYTIKARSWQK